MCNADKFRLKRNQGCSTYNADTSTVGLGDTLRICGNCLQQESLNTFNGCQGLGQSTHGLGQHHEREAQDVEQGQGGEGQCGCQTADHHLVGSEDDAGSHGRSTEHHGDVDGLDDGVLELQGQLTGTDGADLVLEEWLPGMAVASQQASTFASADGMLHCVVSSQKCAAHMLC